MANEPSKPKKSSAKSSPKSDQRKYLVGVLRSTAERAGTDGIAAVLKQMERAAMTSMYMKSDDDVVVSLKLHLTVLIPLVAQNLDQRLKDYVLEQVAELDLGDEFQDALSMHLMDLNIHDVFTANHIDGKALVENLGPILVGIKVAFGHERFLRVMFAAFQSGFRRLYYSEGPKELAPVVERMIRAVDKGDRAALCEAVEETQISLSTRITEYLRDH